MTATTVETLLGTEAVAAVRRPIEAARGLPAKAYTSAEYYRLEQQTLFPRQWYAAAFTTDIPDVGDAVPVTVAGVPLILVRDRDGSIKGFHNVCRHRAAMVLPAPAKNLNQFACPYHAWAWTLGGELRATPYFDGTKAAKDSPIVWAENGLLPVRVGVSHPLIFINLDGEAPPLETTLEPYQRHVVGNLDLGTLRFGHVDEWEFDANWKTIGDNWEIYHHTWVHGNFFRSMSEDLDFETGLPKWTSTADGVFLGLRDKRSMPNKGRNDGLPLIPSKDGTPPNHHISTNYLIPNVISTLYPEHLHLAIIDPLAPDRTRLRLAFFFVGDAATDPRFTTERETIIDKRIGASRDPKKRDGIRNQDIAIWEGQQIARGSPAADDLKFSATWESNVHHFQNSLLDVMQRGA
ncbi:MAG TPA: aromatic ring-hydroxylating dioxygenase subunit alpha [Stellaceae bacterium]|jgi:choline monooxygenase|nr:aromatic ring-hydroxylating dioxygenase subunit alpha [Stellaceae bacterium]